MLLLLQTLLFCKAFCLVLLQPFKKIFVDDDLGDLVDAGLPFLLRLLHLLLRLQAFFCLSVFEVLVQLQESRVRVVRVV